MSTVTILVRSCERRAMEGTSKNSLVSRFYESDGILRKATMAISY